MTRPVFWMWVCLIVVIPIPGKAALQDWYGVWHYSMTGVSDPSSRVSCTLTITEATAAQASGRASCTAPDGEAFTVPGQVAVVANQPGEGGTITFDMSVTDAGIAWTAHLAASDGRTGLCSGASNGTVQGDNGSGSWTATCNASDGNFLADMGSWSMSRASATSLPPPPAAQTAYAAPAGKISDASVEVETTGTYASASVSVRLDIVKVLQDAPPSSALSGFAAGATYNVYVVARVPGALLGSTEPVWFMKAKASWESLVSPIAAFLENAEQAADISKRILIEIVSSTDLTALIGTEIYIGYGTSGSEMLATGRYRGVYKVQ